MASTGEVWRLGRRPALDGLRGVAVLLVIAYHLRAPVLGVAAGPVGVAVFFTLSGFLITGLLLAETKEAGRVSLVRFYAKRARRLLPAFAAMVVAWLLLDLALHGRFTETRLVLGSLTYTANLVMASGIYHNGGDALGHTWSLAIEEQFYLLWPLALLWLRRFPRPMILSLLAGMALLSLGLRELAWMAGRAELAYYGSAQRMDGLLIGCGLAIVLHGSRVRRAPRWLAPLGLAVAAACIPFDGAFQYVWMPTVVSLATTAVLYAISMGRGSVLEVKHLRWVGERSYGLYLYHPLIVFAVHELMPGASWVMVGALALPLSFALCAASWTWLEEPVLSRKLVAKVLHTEVQGVAALR